MSWSREEIEKAGLHEFKEFLRVVWVHQGLPKPNAVQLEFADFLQYGPKRIVIEAYRGAGKTWITGAFVVWLLFLDPQLNIKIVSASQDFADNISKFIEQLVLTMPILAFMRPKEGQRKSAVAFDVGPALPDPAPSVSSIGLGGQLTGNRADVIIADDIETSKNSITDLLRLKVRETVKEFASLLKPLPTSRIIYLGTPHVEATLYNELAKRGYTVRIWPSRVPQFPEKYLGRLSPLVKKMVADGVPHGTPVEPIRHNDAFLKEAEVEQGWTHHQMQFMLDPSPADANRFPLRTGDMLVYDMDELTTPIRFVHSRDEDYVIPNYPSGGLDGDCWRKPMFESDERSEFQGTVMAIDPSGLGQDETGYAIIRYAQGMLYLVAAGGFHNGLSPETQQSLAVLAVEHHVTHVAPEPNYGGGAFGMLLKPWLTSVTESYREARPDEKWIIPTLVEDLKWSVGQKEVRILDVLEPVVQSHKLLIDRKVIDADMIQQENDFRYSLVYQMTRMTRDRGALAHEDRLEALAMACDFYRTRLARDQIKMVQRKVEADRTKQLRRLMEISRQGGVMWTDNRIGADATRQNKPKRTMHTPCGNTPFDWRPGKPWE